MPGFRGCRYIAADLALTDPSHPVHAEITAYRHRLHTLLEQELKDMAHSMPSEAADDLMFIIDGALVAGATRPETNPARTARILSDRIIDGAMSADPSHNPQKRSNTPGSSKPKATPSR